MDILNDSIKKFIKPQRIEFGLGSFIGLVLLGVIFITAGYFVFRNATVKSGWIKTSGSVVSVVQSRGSNGSTMYSATVQYEIDGAQYRVTDRASSSIHPTIGDIYQVTYNPASPNEAMVVPPLWVNMLFMLFPALGVFMIIYAYISYMKSRKHSRNIQFLLTNGFKTTGIIVDIQSYGTRRSSYTIDVSAPDMTGVVQTYTSDVLNGIGGLAMTDYKKNPVPVTVYIDSANPKNYYVDISQLPEITPERIAELIKSATSLNANIPGSSTTTQSTPPTI